MVRFMADAIDPSQYPASINVPGRGVQPIALRAGYVNGNWPTARIGTEVTIDVNGSAPGADVLDVEPGDATPDTVPGWIRAHRAQTSERAVIYCNRSTMTPVANACDAAGMAPGRDFFWWVATLDGTERVPDMTGVVAVQAWGAQFFGGRNIDVSIVVDDSWKGGDDMANAQDVINFLQNITGADLRLINQKVTETRDRTLGFLQQRYYVKNADGTLTPAAADAPGAIPAGALDTLDGNFLVQQLVGLNAALQAVTAALAHSNGADPAVLKQAVEDGMNAALANIHVVTGQS